MGAQKLALLLAVFFVLAMIANGEKDNQQEIMARRGLPNINWTQIRKNTIAALAKSLETLIKKKVLPSESQKAYKDVKKLEKTFQDTKAYRKKYVCEEGSYLDETEKLLKRLRKDYRLPRFNPKLPFFPRDEKSFAAWSVQRNVWSMWSGFCRDVYINYY